MARRPGCVPVLIVASKLAFGPARDFSPSRTPTRTSVLDLIGWMRA